MLIINFPHPFYSVRIFGDRRLVVILCEFKIPTNELINSLTEALLDFSERHKSPSVCFYSCVFVRIRSRFHHPLAADSRRCPYFGHR